MNFMVERSDLNERVEAATDVLLAVIDEDNMGALLGESAERVLETLQPPRHTWDDSIRHAHCTCGRRDPRNSAE